MERNFCQACGKLLGTGVHTCSPQTAVREVTALRARVAEQAGCKVKPDGFITYRDEPVGSMLERFANLVTAEKDAEIAKLVQAIADHVTVRTTQHERIKELEADKAALTEALKHDRVALQAEAKHPSPCQKFCEATAFRIQERQHKSTIAAQSEQIQTARKLIRNCSEYNLGNPEYEAFIARTGGDL